MKSFIILYIVLIIPLPIIKLTKKNCLYDSSSVSCIQLRENEYYYRYLGRIQ